MCIEVSKLRQLGYGIIVSILLLTPVDRFFARLRLTITTNKLLDVDPIIVSIAIQMNVKFLVIHTVNTSDSRPNFRGSLEAFISIISVYGLAGIFSTAWWHQVELKLTTRQLRHVLPVILQVINPPSILIALQVTVRNAVRTRFPSRYLSIIPFFSYWKFPYQIFS
ncbi:hypothetical protein M8J76_013314 [Diaphorina citri]|nr:hypothetical protein M8J76_013314 [Diaphorina citri]